MTSAPRRKAAGAAALGGVVGAAVGSATGDVAAVVLRSPSPVAAVADAVVDRAPGAVLRAGIDAFAPFTKPVVVLAVLAVLAAVGAATGRRTARRPWLPWAVAAPCAVIGALAAGTIDAPFRSGVAALLAGVAGAVTTGVLVRAARGGRPARDGEGVDAPTASPLDPPGTRRSFLGLAAAGGAFAVLAPATVRRIRSWGPATPPPVGALPAPTVRGPVATSTFDGVVPGLSPAVTPNDAFYRIDTAFIVPRVDVAGWTLDIGGLVQRPRTLRYADLLEMPLVEEEITLACVSNEVGDELVGNARWTGVPLARLLEEAGVLAEGEQVMSRSVDGWTAGFPTSVALDGRAAMVAVGMNGEPLPYRHGFPARLVVPGIYGYVSATKWLAAIDLVPWDRNGYWVPRGWAKLGPIKTQSRIDVPRAGTRLAAGRTTIAGVAWAPVRGVRAVEVSVDEGPWQRARLAGGAGPATWVQWLLDWEATPGLHRIRVRATDGQGETQTQVEQDVAPDGATGWHRVQITVD
ncbi:MAG: molybdopterin-binding oxidoreductase [Actinobacteria bacterium]|nr:molybdopterin-binding oxidoreductase [Actinomycetota bacterium]